jgi:hypothetical protein
MTPSRGRRWWLVPTSSPWKSPNVDSRTRGVNTCGAPTRPNPFEKHGRFLRGLRRIRTVVERGPSGRVARPTRDGRRIGRSAVFRARVPSDFRTPFAQIFHYHAVQGGWPAFDDRPRIRPGIQPVPGLPQPFFAQDVNRGFLGRPSCSLGGSPFLSPLRLDTTPDRKNKRRHTACYAIPGIPASR